ncbi:unknown [Parabacteroides sp. CAG:409]|nr:unknown [Parabacteroides sp. CAG:409]
MKFIKSSYLIQEAVSITRRPFFYVPMSNEYSESTPFIYKEILSQLNSLYANFLSFHPGDTIVSPRWYDRSTQVKRSFHKGGTVKNKWDLEITD